MLVDRFWVRLTCAAVAVVAMGACATKLPTPAETRGSVWLDQGWPAEERARFHHADQGTLTFGIPYEWFVALEQPTLSPKEAPLIGDKAWLDRFGYIPDDFVLPVGFARSPAFSSSDMKPWTNPATGAKMTGIGLTCAACHTGRMTYQGTEILIDGGSAMTDVVALNKALHFGLQWTQLVPARFTRFADRVLGANADAAAKAALRKQMSGLLGAQNKVALLEIATTPGSPTEGIGRLDAINRIGNQVFGLDMGVLSNYHRRTAPVHYPHVWTAPWFSWVQYNGSIQQPMVRNAGEAMGVAASLNLTRPGPGLFDSSVPVDQLHWIEQTLAGRQAPFASRAFSGLRSPAWPSILPPIDKARADKGAALYQELCQGCHLPAPNTAAFWNAGWWKQIDGKGDHYLDLKQIPVAEVGTDPAMADGMAQRKVKTNGVVKLKDTSFGLALGELVEKVVNHWYDTRTPPVPPEVRAEMNGNRPNGLRADRAYKARPLNGIWAVPPYLHNGSVPDLYALLSPVNERPSEIQLGDREFDPVRVGYRGNKIDGGFTLKTSIAGNRNTGHAFTDVAGAPGRIGRGLTPEERMALIEYLKTL